MITAKEALELTNVDSVTIKMLYDIDREINSASSYGDMKISYRFTALCKRDDVIKKCIESLKNRGFTVREMLDTLHTSEISWDNSSYEEIG